jgi:hypothetical protein
MRNTFDSMKISVGLYRVLGIVMIGLRAVAASALRDLAPTPGKWRIGAGYDPREGRIRA